MKELFHVVEYSAFLKELDKKMMLPEREILEIGDKINMDIVLYQVKKDSPDEPTSLRNIFTSLGGDYLLLVLNRHFS
ncbi:hypothetical protein Avbf_13473 [Armadillidium vulgare]|nr:hypothetical protein Avbf_13473 [Armadillidium vulgare]